MKNEMIKAYQIKTGHGDVWGWAKPVACARKGTSMGIALPDHIKSTDMVIFAESDHELQDKVRVICNLMRGLKMDQLSDIKGMLIAYQRGERNFGQWTKLVELLHVLLGVVH